MERWVVGRRGIAGDPERIKEVLLTSTPEILQAATDMPISSPDGDGGFTLRLRGRVGGLPTHKMVVAHVGEALRRDHWMSIPLRWEADRAGPLFPVFDGSLELEDLSRTNMDVVIVGRYRPPLGPIGGLGDIAGAGDVAKRTVQWLVDRVGRALIDRLYGDAPPATPTRHAMTVRDIMTPDPLVLSQELPLRSGAALLRRGRISGAPVVNDDGRVIGVLSERDLLDKAARRSPGFGAAARTEARHRNALTVGEACTRPARMTEADTIVQAAAAAMVADDLDRLVVMDGAKHVGIVTRSDVLKSLTRDQDLIEDTVRDVMAELGCEDLDVEVIDGIAHLSGHLSLRSQKIALHDSVEVIDGVMAVEDGGVRWDTDDLMPPNMPIL